MPGSQEYNRSMKNGPADWRAPYGISRPHTHPASPARCIHHLQNPPAALRPRASDHGGDRPPALSGSTVYHRCPVRLAFRGIHCRGCPREPVYLLPSVLISIHRSAENKNQSSFLDKNICTGWTAAMARQEGAGGFRQVPERKATPEGRKNARDCFGRPRSNSYTSRSKILIHQRTIPFQEPQVPVRSPPPTIARRQERKAGCSARFFLFVSQFHSSRSLPLPAWIRVLRRRRTPPPPRS